MDTIPKSWLDGRNLRTITSDYLKDINCKIEITHLMENVIYNELNRRGYAVDFGIVEIRDKNNKIQTEIDFVCNFGSKKYYIQSALNIENKKKESKNLDP